MIDTDKLNGFDADRFYVINTDYWIGRMILTTGMLFILTTLFRLIVNNVKGN